ncbi:MAG: hypothetical protein DGJ47_001179, partial [Rickettsiaceae bacterium]
MKQKYTEDADLLSFTEDFENTDFLEDIDCPKIVIPDSEEERAKTLNEIQNAHQNAVTLFHDGRFLEAEQEIIKVIRPVLSKPLMKNTYVDLKDVLSPVLESMYYLGLIYLQNASNDQQYPYIKASSIFQYCAKFYEKFSKEHDIKLNLPYGATANTKYFINQAFAVEQQFLTTLGEFSPNYSLAQSKKQISGYQNKLETIRKTTKEQLTYIEDLTIEDIDIRADGVEQIYEYATEFFVNHDPKSKQYQQGLLQALITDCYQQLGKPPEGCEHSILGLGSLALGSMTPWSDLELAILINEDKPEYKEYFRRLTKLLWIKVINFGETPLAAVGIECLNNYKTGEELDDWFHDDVIEKAFRFDPVYVDACKSPLGRQGGYQIKEKVKDPEAKIETGEILTKNEPDYELICTKEQLLEFQQQDHWFECDKHLTQALQTVSLVDGSQTLLDEYRQNLNDKVEHKIQQKRALQILQEDLNKFSLKLGKDEEGNLLDAKKDIYRLGDRIINALANYYNITAKTGEKHITVWQIIERMEKGNILSPEGAQHLREAICISTELRLRTYSDNEGRYDNMSTYEFAVDHLDEAQRKALTQKTFHIKDTSILHHFYYVMFAVQETLKDFCDQGYHDEAKIMLQEEKLLYDGDYIKGMVHARFLQYDKAIEYLEQTKKNDPENLDLLQDLFFIYKKTGAIRKRITIAEQLLSLDIIQHNENNNYENFTKSLCNLSNTYIQKGRYDEAIKYYAKALKIQLSIYQDIPYHPNLVKNYSNIGLAHAYKGEYNKAIIYSQKALEIQLKIYATNPNHPEIALNYSNLGASYMHKGEYDKAIIYSKQALAIQKI